MKQDEVSVNLPPGSREGFKVVLPGEGHEVVENFSKQKGDLEVTINSVKSGNFQIFSDRMELRIIMSVMDALQVVYC